MLISVATKLPMVAFMEPACGVPMNNMPDVLVTMDVISVGLDSVE